MTATSAVAPQGGDVPGTGGDGAAGFACRGVSAGYGRLTVVRDVDLELVPGQVLALLGPNGAGKTTLLNCIAGFVQRHDGDITLEGRSLPNGRPTVAASRGIGLVPDDRALFTRLTVAENLEVVRHRGSPPARAVLQLFPALEQRWNVTAGNLSGGEQQMLAVARALLREPKVLLIDEMSMGLAPLVVESLMPIVRCVADETGAMVVLVEQHVRLALEVADTAMVLVHGQVRLQGPAHVIAGDADRLEAAYLGHDVSNDPETPARPDGPAGSTEPPRPSPHDPTNEET